MWSIRLYTHPFQYYETKKGYHRPLVTYLITSQESQPNPLTNQVIVFNLIAAMQNRLRATQLISSVVRYKILKTTKLYF